jgi:hypothetical protein
MNTRFKSSIPLAFLCLASLWWWFYYSSSNFINDYGDEKHEWLFMLDALIVLPVLCFLCESDKQKAVLKAIVLCCSAVFIGAIIIPEQNKVVFHYLESGRNFAIGALLALEIGTLITVSVAVRALLIEEEDPDLALKIPIERILGSSLLCNLFQFEGRMWSFALFASHIKSSAYLGKQHFYYHKKDGAQSNLMGFIIVIMTELPLVHLLLHFLWSSAVANIVSAFTLFGLVFFYAEYKAVAIRPISIYKDRLIVRYGLFQPFIITFSNISDISTNTTFVKRAKGIKRFNYAGVPNVKIKLNSPIDGKHAVYLGVDSPDMLIDTLKRQLCSFSINVNE